MARTLSDLRRTATPEEIHRATRQAEVLGLAVGDDGDVAHRRTNGELEARFLALCRTRRFPDPEVNVRVAGHQVDFLWRRWRLVVETDGYGYHRGPTAFEDDHRRDLDLAAAGFLVRRFSFRQVVEQPDLVAKSLAGALRDQSRRSVAASGSPA